MLGVLRGTARPVDRFNIMAEPRIGTLGDLDREGRVVTVYCPENRSASLPGWYLAERFGADLPLQNFMDRCLCQCGRRANDLKIASFAYGTGIALDRRCPFQPPETIAASVRAVRAVVAALSGTRSDDRERSVPKAVRIGRHGRGPRPNRC
jgi:hypothetical protein